MADKPISYNASRFIILLLQLGSTSPLNVEERRRRISAVFILLAGILVTIGFCPYHIYAGHYFIVATLVAVALVFWKKLLTLRQTEQGGAVYRTISLFFMVLFTIIVIMGRSDISYFLWAFLFPAIAFAVLGKHGGLPNSLAFFLLSLLLMAVFSLADASGAYHMDFIGRYSVVYMALTLIFYYYEGLQTLLSGHIRHERDKHETTARHDKLTGLPNRLDITEKLKTEQLRQLRLGKPFTIIIGDIDNFKELNESCGRDSGDNVLKTVAQLLIEQVRDLDCPARWEGGTFLIMLVETDIEVARMVAERIRKKIEETAFSHNGTPLTVTMTLGLSVHQTTDIHLDSCIKRANQALAAGKQQGKNRVIVG